jgi:hypothetical protein
MANVLKLVFRKSMFSEVTNRDFFTPGDDNPKSTKSIRSKNQKFSITTLLSNGWSNYSGSDLTFNEAKEIVSTLTIDTFKSLSDKIMSLAMFKSSVTDPKSAVIESAGGKLKATLDKAILAFYGDAGSGNWVGTSYVTGTVAIDVAGAVTGSGTTFAAGMVGKPFKAAGLSKWYRVKTYSSTTSIVIEDDSDDEASAYTGGVISAGAAYEIQANTKIALTKTNISQYLIMCSQLLDEAHGDNDELQVPAEDRFIILPAVAKSPLLTAAEFNADIEKVYDETVERGVIAKAYGFKIYIAPSTWFTGDNTNGYMCIFGHKSWLTAGFGFIEPVSIIEAKENQTNFGDKIKGLFGYGFKVADIRRMCGGVLYATFS